MRHPFRLYAFLLLLSLVLPHASLGAAESIFVSDPSPQVEGTDITVVLTRSDTAGSVDVTWTLTGGTATATTDFEALGGGTTGTATFFDGFDTALAIIQTVSGDGPEGPEDFTIAFDPVAGYSFVGSLPLTATILDGDGGGGGGLPELSLDQLNPIAGEGGSIVYTVTATPPPATPIVVPLVYIDGLGVSSPADYSGPATVTVGTDGTGTFTVNISSDAEVETDEMLSVGLDAGAEWTLGFSLSFATLTDATPVISIDPTTASITEGGAATVLTVTATPAPVSDIEVPLTYTGVDGSDYSGPASVTITSSGSATVSVSAPVDGVVESDEIVTVTLGSGATWVVGTPDSAAVTIVDATSLVSFTAATASVTEGDSVTINVTASPAPATAITVPLAYTGATTDVSGPTTVTVGTDGTGSFSISGSTDALVEASETVTVTLGGGATWEASATALTLTVDDGAAPDVPVLTLSADSLVIPEYDGYLDLQVTASPAPAAPVTVPVTYAYTGSLSSGLVRAPTAVTIGVGGHGVLRVRSYASRPVQPSSTCTVSLGDGALWDLSASASLVLVQEPLSRIYQSVRVVRTDISNLDNEALGNLASTDYEAYKRNRIESVFAQTQVTMDVTSVGPDTDVEVEYRDDLLSIVDVQHVTMGAGQTSVTLAPEAWRETNAKYALSSLGGREEIASHVITVTIRFTDPTYGVMSETFKMHGKNGSASGDCCYRETTSPVLEYRLDSQVGGADQPPPAPSAMARRESSWLPLIAIASVGWSLAFALSLFRRKR